MRHTIDSDVAAIKREVLRLTPPDHFSSKDIARSFFGALFITSTFIFSGTLISQAKSLSPVHLVVLVLVTLIVLTVEIYFIGFERITNTRSRPFYEFWGKRVITFWVVGVLVSFGLAYLYGFANTLSTVDLVKFAIVTSLPASVGAAVADLLRSY